MRLRIRFGLQLILAAGIAAPGMEVHYLPLAQVKELIQDMVSAGAPDVPADEIKDVASWDRWIRGRDHEIRSRIDRGIEDSISNLMIFGTSFTTLPPIAGFAQAADLHGQLNETARARVHALALAILRPGENERVNLARDFLGRRRVGGDSVEPYLTRNLQRMIAEERAYVRNQQVALKTGDADTVLMDRATIFKQRGLSFDTSLEPDFALETMLRQLVRKGLMNRGSVRRIAVIGPGLDFADKRTGLDFYPVQTTQPFAILESVVRLELGELQSVRVVACDLNPYVLDHIGRLAAQGKGGRSYEVQLPKDSRNGWDTELTAYWQHFGELLGSPARALHAPQNLQGVEVRAVAIRPQVAARISGQDLDIVAQQLTVPRGRGFDLVIATNVFLYYNFFEQALAMQNITEMMNPGGLLLVNQVLSNQHPDSLRFIDQCYVSFSTRKRYGDNVVAYQRQ